MWLLGIFYSYKIWSFGYSVIYCRIDMKLFRYCELVLIYVFTGRKRLLPLARDLPYSARSPFLFHCSRWILAEHRRKGPGRPFGLAKVCLLKQVYCCISPAVCGRRWAYPAVWVLHTVLPGKNSSLICTNIVGWCPKRTPACIFNSNRNWRDEIPLNRFTISAGLYLSGTDTNNSPALF